MERVREEEDPGDVSKDASEGGGCGVAEDILRQMKM